MRKCVLFDDSLEFRGDIGSRRRSREQEINLGAIQVSILLGKYGHPWSFPPVIGMVVERQLCSTPLCASDLQECQHSRIVYLEAEAAAQVSCDETFRVYMY